MAWISSLSTNRGYIALGCAVPKSSHCFARRLNRCPEGESSWLRFHFRSRWPMSLGGTDSKAPGTCWDDTSSGGAGREKQERSASSLLANARPRSPAVLVVSAANSPAGVGLGCPVPGAEPRLARIGRMRLASPPKGTGAGTLQGRSTTVSQTAGSSGVGSVEPAMLSAGSSAASSGSLYRKTFG